MGPAFIGQLVIVDLNTESVTRRDLPQPILRRLLGGRGLNAHWLAGSLQPDTDPLGPDNSLIFSCGLLTGAAAPSASRLHAGARSPLTGLLGSSNVGGFVGAEMRAAGIQALLIHGRAKRPSILWIDREQITLRDATSIWGLDTRQATECILNELSAPARLMVIGPAGERLVRYACIMTDSRHAAGRTGLGAVMGAKNLKAIAVYAGQPVSSSDKAAHNLLRDYVARLRAAPRYPIYSRLSNSAYINWANEAGLLATHNYQRVGFEGAARIDGSRLIDYVTRSKTCYGCPVHCKAEIEIRRGRYAGTIGERPDIEPIMGLGARCGLDDPEALLYLYNLTSDLGLDSISAAGALAFAMELFQRGIITPEDTDGICLTWGNAEAMERMLHQIAERQGFGAILAEGVRRAAQLIGRGAEAYAYHVKGLELTGYDPRGGMGTALGHAISSRGADFTSVYPIPEYRWSPAEGQAWFGNELSVDRLRIEGKGALVRRAVSVSAALDALGLCKVPILSVLGDFSLQHEAELVRAIACLEITPGELLEAGERIYQMERLINLRLGASRAEDDLPDRFTEEPIRDAGPTQGMTVDIQTLVKDFYAAMGWDATGRPTPERLAALHLEHWPSDEFNDILADAPSPGALE